MLLAEELLLLTLDDEKGTGNPTGIEAGLAGALLLELGLDGAIEERDGKLVATRDSASGGLPEAARAAIGDSADESREVAGWVTRLPKRLKPLRQQVAQGLCDQGIVGVEQHKVLGIPAGTRYPELDPEPERQLRERLRSVLLGEREPNAHDAALAGLLIPFNLDRDLVNKDQRKPARKRAEALADGSAASAAVAHAVKAIQAGVMVAIVASTAASTAASS